MPETNALSTAKKPTARSRVSNGSALLVGADQRSAWARRFRDLFEAYSVECGGVGTSPSRQALVRRAACLSVELERMEAAFAGAGADMASLSAYQTHTNALRRLLEVLGTVKSAPVEAPGADASGEIDYRRLAVALFGKGLRADAPHFGEGGPNGEFAHTYTHFPHKNLKKNQNPESGSDQIDLAEKFQKKSETENQGEADPDAMVRDMPRPGDFEVVGDDESACTIECSEVRNQRGKWAIYSPTGVLLTVKWDRDAAVAAAQQFLETGSITV